MEIDGFDVDSTGLACWYTILGSGSMRTVRVTDDELDAVSLMMDHMCDRPGHGVIPPDLTQFRTVAIAAIHLAKRFHNHKWLFTIRQGLILAAERREQVRSIFIIGAITGQNDLCSLAISKLYDSDYAPFPPIDGISALGAPGHLLDPCTFSAEEWVEIPVFHMWALSRAWTLKVEAPGRTDYREMAQCFTACMEHLRGRSYK